MSLNTKCRAKRPVDCTDPNCPERKSFYQSLTESVSSPSNADNTASNEFSAVVSRLNSIQMNPKFLSLLSGKEIGHGMANFIDDEISAWLIKEYGAVYQQGDNSFSSVWTESTQKRSMGDIWMNRFTPVNIKTGIVSTGRPNMVSIKRLIKAVEEKEINEYNIFYLKFNIQNIHKVSCVPQYFNLLDNLDVISYDAGPGQTMLVPEKLAAKKIGHFIPPKFVFNPDGLEDQKRKEILFSLYTIASTGIDRKMALLKTQNDAYKSKMKALRPDNDKLE